MRSKNMFGFFRKKPQGKIVCHCKNISEETIVSAIQSGAKTLSQIRSKTQAGTNCGSCTVRLHELLKENI